MKASELFHSLIAEDEGKTYWVANFVLNDNPFKQYAANVMPTPVVIRNFPQVLQKRKNHDTTRCKAGYHCRANFDFQVIKKNGELARKTISSTVIHSYYEELQVYMTEAEALDGYESMVSEGIIKMDETYAKHTEKARNNLMTVQQRKNRLR